MFALFQGCFIYSFQRDNLTDSLQIERNLQDAMNVTRNVIMNPILVPGGGACEMALSHVCSFLTLYYF
jgi:hypothetical protein